MKFITNPPGDGGPMVDAYNLVACAFAAINSPDQSEHAQVIARQIEQSINDWEVVGGYIAMLAATFATAANPEVAEKIRVAIEANNLIPA